MNRKDAQNISILTAERREIPRVRDILFAIIDEIDIYNELAKNYERELYSLEYLHSLVEEDAFSILVAKRENEICGFVITKPDNGPIWLCWFGVAPGARGLGVGARLIDGTVKFAEKRGVYKIWCDTRTNNRFSIPIMTSFGFEKLARLDNHWCHQDYFLWQKFIGDKEIDREQD